VKGFVITIGIVAACILGIGIGSASFREADKSILPNAPLHEFDFKGHTYLTRQGAILHAASCPCGGAK
jgi:hypothetical protein